MSIASFRIHGIRYQTRDVNRAVAFYTQHLGFELKHQQGTAFASVSCDGVDLLLSGPESSGARPMPDGQQQAPGGWNRLVLAVNDLPAVVASLKIAASPSGTRSSQDQAASRFRFWIRTGTRLSCSSPHLAADRAAARQASRSADAVTVLLPPVRILNIVAIRRFV